METVLSIFKQLSANQTMLHQFGVVCVLFITSKFLFFKKLQFVLENREEKTTKLEQSAEVKFEEANKLCSQYKEKLSTARENAKKLFNEKKDAIIAEESTVLKKEEETAANYLSSARKEFLKEIEIKKGEILAEADNLANSLVQKLTRN